MQVYGSPLGRRICRKATGRAWSGAFGFSGPADESPRRGGTMDAIGCLAVRASHENEVPMPALITHYLFGEEVLPQVDDVVGSSDTERDAFLIGCQGPDPFFFGVTTPRGSDVRALGREMHRRKMGAALGRCAPTWRNCPRPTAPWARRSSAGCSPTTCSTARRTPTSTPWSTSYATTAPSWATPTTRYTPLSKASSTAVCSTTTVTATWRSSPRSWCWRRTRRPCARQAR